MTEPCKFCKGTHETMKDIEHCFDIRKNIVKSNLIMHGLNTEKRFEDWWE